MKRFDELERYLKSAELVDGVSEQDREEILEAVRRIRALPRSERRCFLAGSRRVRDADRQHGRGRKIG